MTVFCARIERVEFAVHNAIERHRAGPRANHRRQNQPENFPARPAAVIARGHEHRRQRERQRKDRVREADEAAPFLNGGDHSFSSAQRGAILLGRPMWSSTRATTVSTSSTIVFAPE